MQTCRVCNVECSWKVLACGECVSLIHSMLSMRHCVTTATERAAVVMTTPKNTRTKGLTVEKMLQRIGTHWAFGRLPWRVHMNIRHIGRFDHRRNKQDNDYVRDLYHYLSGLSEINVY